MAVRARSSELAKQLLSRHAAAGVAAAGSRSMASGHGLDPAQSSLQQQASCRPPAAAPRTWLPPGVGAGRVGRALPRTGCLLMDGAAQRSLHCALHASPLLLTCCSALELLFSPARRVRRCPPDGFVLLLAAAACPPRTTPVPPPPPLQYIDKEEKYGAHNYHPLPVVLNRGEVRPNPPHLRSCRPPRNQRAKQQLGAASAKRPARVCARCPPVCRGSSCGMWTASATLTSCRATRRSTRGTATPRWGGGVGVEHIPLCKGLRHAAAAREA